LKYQYNVFRTSFSNVFVWFCVGVKDPGTVEEHRLRVAYSAVQKNILGARREKVREGRGKLHAEELRDMNSPPNIIWVTTPMRLRWMGQLKRIGKTYTCTGF
jgi:hypothetical protein